MAHAKSKKGMKGMAGMKGKKAHRNPAKEAGEESNATYGTRAMWGAGAIVFGAALTILGAYALGKIPRLPAWLRDLLVAVVGGGAFLSLAAVGKDRLGIAIGGGMVTLATGSALMRANIEARLQAWMQPAATPTTNPTGALDYGAYDPGAFPSQLPAGNPDAAYPRFAGDYAEVAR